MELESKVGKTWLVKVLKEGAGISEKGEALKVGEYLLLFRGQWKKEREGKKSLSFRVDPEALEVFRRVARVMRKTHEELVKELLLNLPELELADVKARTKKPNARVMHSVIVDSSLMEVLKKKAGSLGISPSTYLAILIEKVFTSQPASS